MNYYVQYELFVRITVYIFVNSVFWSEREYKWDSRMILCDDALIFSFSIVVTFDTLFWIIFEREGFMSAAIPYDNNLLVYKAYSP